MRPILSICVVHFGCGALESYAPSPAVPFWFRAISVSTAMMQVTILNWDVCPLYKDSFLIGVMGFS